MRRASLEARGSGPKGAATPATTGGGTAPAARPALVAKPQAYLATVHGDSECEVVYLSNASAGRMEAHPAHLQGSPAKSDKSGIAPAYSPHRSGAQPPGHHARQPTGGIR